MKENNWKEITETEAIDKAKQELIIQAQKFIYNVHHKKLDLVTKLKVGLGRKMIQKAFKKYDDEYFEVAIVTKGLKKIIKTLDKGQEVDFDNFFLKKEKHKDFINDKFFIKFKTKL